MEKLQDLLRAMPLARGGARASAGVGQRCSGAGKDPAAVPSPDADTAEIPAAGTMDLTWPWVIPFSYLPVTWI